MWDEINCKLGYTLFACDLCSGTLIPEGNGINFCLIFHGCVVVLALFNDSAPLTVLKGKKQSCGRRRRFQSTQNALYRIQTSGSVLFLFLVNLFMYLFIFGCTGSSLLWEGFLQLLRAGASLQLWWPLLLWTTGPRVYTISCCCTGVQAQLRCSLWDLPELGIEPVSIGRWILNHWTTREVPGRLDRRFSLEGTLKKPSVNYSFPLSPHRISGGTS